MAFNKYIRAKPGEITVLSYPCENTSVCSPIELNFQSGTYKIELWGAGIYNGGGYTSGEIHFFDKETILSLYLGGKPQEISEARGLGGYNGGGTSTVIGPYNEATRQRGGCGATDIRYNESLYARIIVSGGAGGGNNGCPGGHGGGLIGGDGKLCINRDTSNMYNVGMGGQQNSGGSGKYYGIFGTGGQAEPTLGTDLSGSGGGGWYGGGSGWHVEESCSGGGGSSFINGHPQCQVVSNKYFFQKSVIIPGNESTPSPYRYGEWMSSGLKDNGFARITCMDRKGSCKMNGSNNYFIYIYILLISK